MSHRFSRVAWSTHWGKYCGCSLGTASVYAAYNPSRSAQGSESLLCPVLNTNAFPSSLRLLVQSGTLTIKKLTLQATITRIPLVYRLAKKPTMTQQPRKVMTRLIRGQKTHRPLLNLFCQQYIR